MLVVSDAKSTQVALCCIVPFLPNADRFKKHCSLWQPQACWLLPANPHNLQAEQHCFACASQCLTVSIEHPWYSLEESTTLSSACSSKNLTTCLTISQDPAYQKAIIGQGQEQPWAGEAHPVTCLRVYKCVMSMNSVSCRDKLGGSMLA